MRDAVGDALRLGEELLGLADRLLEAAPARNRAGSRGSCAWLISMVAWFSQALDLVVDLLQLARRRQHVLRVVGGIEDDPLRVRRRARVASDSAATPAASAGAKATAVMARSPGWVVSMSAAQSRPLRAQPGGGEAVAAVGGEDLGDGGLVGLRGGGGEGERDLGEAELEQAVAAARLAVIVALRRRAAEDLDLPVVQAEAAIDRGDLRLERPLIRQEEPGRAALDDRRRDWRCRRCRRATGWRR